MKGDIDQELTPIIQKKLLNKYKIERIERFSLPIEESKRSLIVIKNK